MAFDIGWLSWAWKAGSGIVRTIRSPVGYEGSARLCDWGHPMVMFLDQPDPRGPLHIDVRLRFWNRTKDRVTLLGVAEASIKDQRLTATRYPTFSELTLDPGGPSVEAHFTLRLPDEQPVRAEVGDKLTIRLRSTRGSAPIGEPRVTLVVSESEPE